MTTPQIILLIVAPIALAALGWWATKWPRPAQRIACAIGLTLAAIALIVAITMAVLNQGPTP
jgi:hypothetical protein